VRGPPSAPAYTSENDAPASAGSACRRNVSVVCPYTTCAPAARPLGVHGAFHHGARPSAAPAVRGAPRRRSHRGAHSLRSIGRADRAAALHHTMRRPKCWAGQGDAHWPLAGGGPPAARAGGGHLLHGGQADAAQLAARGAPDQLLVALGQPEEVHLGPPGAPVLQQVRALARAPRSCQGQGQQRPHRVATSGRRRTTQSPYGACVHRNACTGQHALGSMRAEHVATEALTLVSGVPGSGTSASRSPTRWSTDAAVGPGAQHT